MTRVVLDTSALLAYLLGERGASVVEMALSEAVISTVNLAETVTKLSTGGPSPTVVRRTLTTLPLVVFPFDEDQAFHAGFMWRLAKEHGLSLGDRCWLSLALRIGAPVLTADQMWARLPLDVKVKLIRS